MADIQEAVNQQAWGLTEKGTKLTASMLEKMARSFLHYTELDKKLMDAIKGHGSNKMGFKEFMQEMAATHGTPTSLDISENNEIFDMVMVKYGIPYTAQEAPLLDENGKQIFDYSNCVFEMDENKMPVMDYTGCKFEEDENGKPIMDTRTVTPNDKDGNPDPTKAFEVSEPRLAKDSPQPKMKLAEDSPEPEPMKQYTIFFDQRFTEPMTKAFKEYIQIIERKKSQDKDKAEDKAEDKTEDKTEDKDKSKDKNKSQDKEKTKDKNKSKDKDKSERPKKNIKDQIKKFKEKMKKVNKDSPEKHHNRGAQSL